MSRNACARDEKDHSENSPKFGDEKQRVPVQRSDFDEMANMATNLANIRQSLNKNLNDMAKRPFESGNFNENGDFGEKSPKPYLQVK